MLPNVNKKALHTTTCKPAGIHCGIVNTIVAGSFLPYLSKFFNQISRSSGCSIRTKSPGSYLTVAFFEMFFIKFSILEISKRKIKQEVDLFEQLSMSSIGNVKQSRAMK